MSGIKVDGVIFLAYPQDPHMPRHVHGFIGGKPKGKGVGEVIVDLRDDRTVHLADRDDAVRGANPSEVRKVVIAAALKFDRLVAAWEKMHVDQTPPGAKKQPGKTSLAELKKARRSGRK